MRRIFYYFLIILSIAGYFSFGEQETFAIDWWPFNDDENGKQEIPKSREQLEKDLELAEKQRLKAEAQFQEQQQTFKQLQEQVQQQKELERQLETLKQQLQTEMQQNEEYQQQVEQLQQRRFSPLWLSLSGLLFIAYRFGVARGTSRKRQAANTPPSTTPSTESPRQKAQTEEFVMSPQPAPEEPSPPPVLRGFSLTPELIQKIKRELPQKTGKTPTDSQWNMILSTSPNTYVVAGAGSGKSTSLILRVLVLNHYLHIPLQQVTVFSFTRESTREFRSKLREVFQAYGKQVSEREATQVVRTFHSKILELARGQFPQTTLFEFLAQKNDLGEGGIFESSLNDSQEQYLKELYKELFHSHTEFHDLILSLYHEYLQGQDLGIKSYSEGVLSLAAERDLAVTQAVDGVFDLPGSDNRPTPFSLSKLYQHITFYANAYLPELDQYIVSIPQASLLGERKEMQIHNFPLGAGLSVKKNILLKYSDARIRFIHHERDLNLLREEITWFQQDGHKFTPMFDYSIEGEITSAVIWETFYAVAMFVESMGLEIQDLHKIAGHNQLSATDTAFLKALMIFWKAFDAKLASDRMFRFHHLFTFLSEKHAENFTRLSSSMLNSMAHILIDEFQDISPEVVSWIRGTFNFSRSRQHPRSLLCVGDDWQSIYGWKGSSPRYFIDYEKEFPAEQTRRVDMMENFRSYQEIIDQAEDILTDVKYKIPKHGKAMRGHAPDPQNTVQIIRTDDENEISVTIRQILRDVHDAATSVLIMARANRVLKRLRAEFRGARNVKILTYHQSKGLEADICILVGDCLYNSTIPLKNLIYELAGCSQTYDEAQTEEALRLAYVAITRARNRCYWLAVPKAGGAVFRLIHEEEENQGTKEAFHAKAAKAG